MDKIQYPVYPLIFKSNNPDKSISTVPMGSKRKFWLTLDKVPDSFMSEPAKTFANAILEYSSSKLKELRG